MPSRYLFRRLVILLAVFSFFILCFIHTNLHPITNKNIILYEGSIFTFLAFFFVIKGRAAPLILFLVLLSYFACLWLVRGHMNLQDFRNIIIILFFYYFGNSTKDTSVLRRVFKTATIVILIVGLLEYFLTDSYLKYINIRDFYMFRGGMSHLSDYLDQNVFTSAIRPDGRHIMPFLGNLRVSSIFLEPISMGNFTVILTIWGIIQCDDNIKKGLIPLVFAFIFLIGCDSRFALVMSGIIIAVRFVPILQNKIILMLLPIAVSITLMTQAYLFNIFKRSDDFQGRLTVSGQSLLDMNFLEMIGMSANRNLGDMGIAYSIEHYGIFLCIFLWGLFISIPTPNIQSKRMKAMVAFYIMGILAVSGTSVYSLKTSSILWFMVGSLTVHASSLQSESV
ncbi:hypothetical protein [Desulfovibrio sp. UCD-KL4C]|uniref:hypothetical protein n=1 Tax=Desulfovibrio sp. UCD-KL4C TaxID=2578120 RepID=UPI0025B9A669|nr:hypothetical protein [Desulfovibrio sp. UCD-KL4C]